MMDGRRRIVEVVQQSLPFRKVRMMTESLRMVFDCPPPDEQQVLVLHLDTALQLVREVPLHRPNDPLRLREGGFEIGALTRSDMKSDCFENHEPLEIADDARQSGKPDITHDGPAR